MINNKVQLGLNECIDDLQRKGYLIIQSKDNFRFGCDAVLLSEFAKVKKNEIALDLGSGSGIIPILLEARTDGKFFYGLEIQPTMAEMSMRSVKLNCLEHKIKIIQGDIKNLKEIFDIKFDVITTNPPYIKNGSGIINPLSAKAIARHEVLCTLEDIISNSSAVLKPQGRFYIIHKPYRLSEIFKCLSNYSLEPKKLRLIHPKINAEPSMVMIEAVKNAGVMLKILPPLVMYDENSKYTEEIKKIYWE